MNIKEIIDAERWAPGDHGLAPMPSVDHNDSLDRIQAAVDKLIYSAVVTIELQDQRIAELEAQNLNMMALFRDFYDLEFNRDECWEIIKKYGGDA